MAGFHECLHIAENAVNEFRFYRGLERPSIRKTRVRTHKIVGMISGL